MNELALVAARTLVVDRPRIRIPLVPGDRIVTTAGSAVAPGDILAEHVRDPRIVEIAAGERHGDSPRPGAWIAAEPGRRGTVPAGELLFEHGGRRRIATGPHPDLVVAPASGRVLEVRPGVEVVIEIDGVGIPGSELLGDPGHGRLVLVPGEGDGRIPLEVAHAGSIVVLAGRADAETLTRARAMGIAGAVVPALTDRDRRDVVASEGRQRAGLHRLAPFPVLVLDGYVRRPLAGPIRDLLTALDGHDIGLVGEPPMVVAGLPLPELPRPAPDRVRVRGGPEVGQEGRVLDHAGPRHVGAGVVAEAALVLLDDGRTVAVALGELERFA
jgi:hypothetical protein